MNPEWNKLEGNLTFEERVNHICTTGLKETRKLLQKRTHNTREQTEGAILAFETIEEEQTKPKFFYF